MGNGIFGGNLYPQIFMTDDCDAEKNALSAMWSESELRLCIFHVMQAVWRWLLNSKNGILKEDRQILMLEFQSIVNAYSNEESEILYTEALNSTTAKKYPHWLAYLDTYWVRRERWCKAWRGIETLGHHTNNYSEAAVRIFKDLVLNRCKAYNAVSLLDFTVVVLEAYYVRRLRKFTHSRNPSLRLLLEVQLKKSEYIDSKELIKNNQEHVYLVPSSKDSSIYYEVNTSVGNCSCFSGKCGRFCKHEAAVYKHFGERVPNLPQLTPELKYQIAFLALGEKAESIEFYNSLTSELDCQLELEQHVESRINENHISDPVTNDVQSQDHDQKQKECPEFDITSVLTKIQELDQRFGTNTQAGQKLIKQLDSIKTRAQWDNFVFADLKAARYRQGAAIRVQPTTLSRRRNGVTRGSKRSAAGRPPATCESVDRACKRPRCLKYNIDRNQANAKTH